MKAKTRIGSYSLVLAVNLGVGYYTGFWVGKGNVLAFDVAETADYSGFIEAQLSEGTNAARDEALHNFLAVIEKRKGHWTPTFSEKAYAVDSALTNARLSALAQKRGTSQDAQEYLERAVSFCPQIGWQDCSAEKMVAFAQRLDEHGLFGGKGR
jgi:hypothetical protein